MEISITKTKTKRKPLDIALADLDDLIDGSIEREFLGKRGEESEGGEDERMSLAEKLSKVPSDEEAAEMDTGHEEPDGDEMPDDLKKQLLEALMSES